MNNRGNIPLPTITRLCRLHGLLDLLANRGSMSSDELGVYIGATGATVRKDLSAIGDMGRPGAKYDPEKLKAHIGNKLSLTSGKRACVVGIGKLGSAILDYNLFGSFGFEIAAGFDSNMNAIETKKTSVRLYPTYQMVEVIQRESISLALLCVPVHAAQAAVDRLVEGGIRGIINFTPTPVKSANENVFVSDIDVVSELKILSARIALSAE